MNWFTRYAYHTATDRAVAVYILPGETGLASLPGTCSPVDFIMAVHIGSPVVFSEEELHRVESPLLILIGGQSVIYDPERVYRRAIAMLPNIEAEIIPDASHALNAEKAEYVNARIIKFLTKMRCKAPCLSNGDIKRRS